MRLDKPILVVEDAVAVREGLRILLERVGYRVACAAHGREALDHLRQALRPLVILLDLAMPVMDGWEFRRQQQHDPALALIPVVVLSGESDLPRVAASLGAVGYFAKPVEFRDLLETIRVIGEGSL
jgi:CheY-like chemotaxis protein